MIEPKLLKEEIDITDEDKVYANIEASLTSNTEDFTKESGEVFYSDFADAEIAKSILKDHYPQVSVKEEGNSVKIFYSNSETESLNEKKEKKSKGCFAGPPWMSGFIPDKNPAKAIMNRGIVTADGGSQLTGTMTGEIGGGAMGESLEDQLNPTCVHCGSNDLEFTGSQGDYYEYSCNECGDWTYVDPETGKEHNADEEDIWNGSDMILPEDDLTESIEKHDDLNPDLFGEDKELRPEVRVKLLDIVERFSNYLLDDGVLLKIKDAVIVGSNASYNYTAQSDIDLHILADLSVYKEDEDLAQKLYNAYKTLWNNKYDPLIRGHEVEVYVENYEDSAYGSLEDETIVIEEAVSNGVYSLYKGWIKAPEAGNIPDDVDISAEVEEWKERASRCNNIDDVDQFIDDIYILRQDSILRDGEYGKGNLVFKEIRNLGILDGLKQKKIELQNQEMSL